MKQIIYFKGLPQMFLKETARNLGSYIPENGINEAEQNLEMFNDHLGNMNSAFLAVQLELNGIFIDDGNGAPLLILQATVQTEGELAYHNDKFPEMDDVTMADLAANPPEVYSILFPNPWDREEK